GLVLGLCGGYQMLGRTVADPHGIEGPPGQVDGLDLLDVETVLSADKRLEPIRGTTDGGVPFEGYEMHMGVTAGAAGPRALGRLGPGLAGGAAAARMRGLFHRAAACSDLASTRYSPRPASVRLGSPACRPARPASATTT